MNLEEFIKNQIKSVPELRTLLFFYTFPQTDWDAAEVARKLFMQPPTMVVILMGLVSKGFLASAGAPPRYRYQPESAALADWVVRIAEMDRFQPVTLVNLIVPLQGTCPQGPSFSGSQIEKRNE